MKYKVKVTEMHSDYVWVTANSSQEASEKALEFAECNFECVWSSEVVRIEEETTELTGETND